MLPPLNLHRLLFGIPLCVVVGCADTGEHKAPTARFDTASPAFNAQLFANEKQNPARTDSETSANPQQNSQQSADAIRPLTSAASANWWESFGDAQLTTLIEQALAENPSMAAAEARVIRAQQFAAVAHADSEVTIALDADIERERYSENYLYGDTLGRSAHTEARIAVDFSYEFDFWGRQHALVTAAHQRVGVERAERESARLVLAVAVARNYVALQRAFDERVLATDELRRRDEIASLYAMRVAAGIDSHSVAEQRVAAASDARRVLSAAAQQVEIVKHQLAALCGRGPQTLNDIAAIELGAAPSHIPTQVPLDWLSRRPDIAAQRLRAAAASNDIAAARAEFYPNIDLSAFFGFQALGTNDLLRADSRAYGFGPALHLPLFNRAALRGHLGARNADYELSVDAYNQAVLTAARDAADQTTALRAAATQRDAIDAGLRSLRAVDAASELRFSRGLATRQEILDSASAVAAQQRKTIEQREREWSAALNLIRALGGGYTLDNATARAENSAANYTQSETNLRN